MLETLPSHKKLKLLILIFLLPNLLVLFASISQKIPETGSQRLNHSGKFNINSIKKSAHLESLETFCYDEEASNDPLSGP